MCEKVVFPDGMHQTEIYVLFPQSIFDTIFRPLWPFSSKKGTDLYKWWTGLQDEIYYS